MLNRNIVIGVGILLLLGLGVLFFSTMTKSVIIGAVVENIENEYFKISNFGNSELNEEVIMNGKNSSGSG